MRASRVLLVAGVAVVVFVIDRVTKAWVSDNIPLGTARPVVGDYVRIVHAQNTGAAFGLLPERTTLLSVLSVIAVLAIAINPRMISQLFSSDELVRKAADPYLRSGLVGFPFLTLGLIIYYASLAFSSPMLPFLINAVRCAILIAAVWLSIHFFDAGLFGVGLGVTLSSFAYLAVMLAWLGRSSIWNSTQSIAA